MQIFYTFAAKQKESMSRDEFFKYVRARQFFNTYAPTVKRYYHKLSGIDGNKKPIDFTAQDKEDIKAGIRRMNADMRKAKF